MAKSSPLSRPKVMHHNQRNAFDLSRKALFTANPGQLLPFFCQEVQPGDHFEISENSFTRTQPCNTAAYVRMKEHREFFFVPYRYLWSYWEQFITQVGDFHSSLEYNNAGGYVPATIPCFDMKELIQTYVYNSASSPNYHGDKIDMAGTQYGANFVKLFNLLGYGSLAVNYVNTSSTRLVDTSDSTNLSSNVDGSYALNPFRALAYNKIYMDYYRKADWSGNVPWSYNIDSVSPSNIYITDSSIFQNVFVMHYRPWKLDYFTSVRPSTYWYGLSPGTAPQSGVVTSSLVGLPSAYAGNFSTSTISSNGMAVINSSGALSVNQIRVAFALDKYLRTTQLAGKHYDDQILAHFGEKVNNDIAEETQLIGAFSTPLVISEVVSSADTTLPASGGGTTGAAAGQIFGKGTANGTSGNGVIKFDAHEHGIIMGIYSVGLESDYSATGIDSFNMKRKREDYYMPEFDDIGPHVIVPEQVSSQVLSYPLGDLHRSSVLGLVDPYLEYKVPIDRVYGDMMRGGNLEKWTACRTFGFDPHTISSSIYRNLQVSDLYIDPRVVDNIFGISTALSECLFVDDFTICNAVRNMSVHGQPRL